MRRQPRPTNVPAVIVLSQVEQAALEYARADILVYKNSTTPWIDSDYLSPASSHAVFQSTLTELLLIDRGGVINRLRLIMLARHGSRDADGILARLILEYQSRYESMPVELQAYDMERKTFGPAPQWAGPKKVSRMLRDILITHTTMALVDKFGLPRTKRSAARKSACEIVSMALASVGISIGHKGVEKIVDRYRGVWPEPGWVARMEAWKARKNASSSN
jgi:hypothetical protein